MKKLNIPLVLFLAIGSLVALVGIRFLHGYQVSRSAEKLLTRAEHAQQEGDVEEQIRLLRRYVRHRPDDLENLKLLLEVSRDHLFSSEEISVREISVLLASLEKAIRKNPTDIGLRRQGYIFSAAIGRYVDALDHLSQLKAMDELTTEDRIVMAKCLWRNGDPDEALSELCELTGFDLSTKTFDDERATAPEEVNAYALLAIIYMRDQSETNDLTIPTMIADKAIERNPDSVTAYLNRASFYQENVKGNEGKEKSLADIKKALELAPDDERVILGAAGTALVLGDIEWAKEMADEGLSKHPASVGLHGKRAEIARAENKIEEALDYINQGLEKNQLNGDLLYRRASYEVDLGRIEDARTTIGRLGNGYDRLRVELLNARILMEEEDFLSASQKLEPLRRMAPAGAPIQSLINGYLITCYRRLNQTDKIESLAANSNSVDARFNQAEAYARQGKYKEAMQIYQELLKEKERVTPEGRQRIFQRVLAIEIEVERAKPADQRDWTRVDTLSKALAKELKLRDAALAQFEIELLISKDDVSAARSLAERAVRAYPRQSSFRLILAQLTSDPQQAARLLDQLENALGDSVRLRLARAEQFVKAGGDDMADRLHALEDNTEALRESDRSELWKGLTSVYRNAGMREDAVRTWRKILPRDEKNLGVRLALFDLANDADDLETMNEMLSEIERLTTVKSAEWQVSEARRQLWLVQHDQGQDVQLTEIIDLLENAKLTRPDYAPIYMVQAEVLLLQQQPDVAIESMRTALQKRPGEVSYLRRLADTLVALNRLDEAQSILARLPAEQKRVGDVIAEIRTLLVEAPDEALKRAKQIFPPDSTQPETLMNLVQVYQAINRLPEAIPTLERTLELDPSNSSAWLMYIRSLANAGKDTEAKAAIEKMKPLLSGDNQTLTLGQCYAIVSEFDLAEQAYEVALQADPNDTILLRNLAVLLSGTQQAEKKKTCLTRLVNVKPSDDPETQKNVAWGRRELARQMASSGTYQDFLAALKLVEQNAGGNGELTGEDLAAWLSLCASRPEAASRRMAVDRLNKIRGDRQLTSSENAVLAYVYHAEGRWPEAQRLMIDILAKNPNNPGYITTYIEWLLERKELADAAAWIRKLNPNSVEAVRYAAILLTQQGNPKEASRRILTLVPQRLDEVTAIRILEDLGKYNAGFYELARRQWKAAVEKKPQLIHNYIGYLTRMPDAAGLDEALELSESQLNQAVADERADMATYYLDLGIGSLRSNRKSLPADSPHYQRVEAWFDLARQAQVSDLALAWSEVAFLDVKRDYDRLMALYQELLKRPDMNELQRAVIQNNLAFLYAISNQGDQALAVIGDAISQLGPRSDFLDTRGLAYLASGNFEKAVQDLRSAVTGGQGDASTYFHLALAEQRSGNVAEAVTAIRKADTLGLDEADLSKPERSLYRQLMKTLEPQLSEVDKRPAR